MQASSREADLSSGNISPDNNPPLNNVGEAEQQLKLKQKPHRPQGSKTQNPRIPQRTKASKPKLQQNDHNADVIEKKPPLASGKKVFQEDLVISIGQESEDPTTENKFAALKASKTIFTVSYDSQSNSPKKGNDSEVQELVLLEAPAEYTTAKDNNPQDLFSDTESEFDFNRYRIDTDRSPKKTESFGVPIQSRELNKSRVQDRELSHSIRRDNLKTAEVSNSVKPQAEHAKSTQKRENSANPMARKVQETPTIFSKSYYELAVSSNNE